LKIIIEEKASREDEDTIIVRCASLNESILKLLQQLKAGDELITCTQNGTIARIRPDDVYYFESVDNKTFLYTEKEVYEIRQKLYEIEDSYLFANATGVGMKPLEGQMVIPDASFLRKDLIVTDVVYMPTETELLRVAKEVGCKTMNGLGMMLYQGAAAFELWTGKEMPIDYMKEILDIKF
jgi:shikimate 5-dehydrogenase